VKSLDEGEVFPFSEEKRAFDKNTIMIRSDKARLDRTVVYETYRAWAGATGDRKNILPQKEFYAGLLAQGFKHQKSGDVRYIVGLTTRARSDSAF
jgi:hypothetical protein